MHKTFKFRLYPNEKQEILINKTIGCTRFIYNYYLNKKIEAYNKEKKTLSAFDCIKDVTVLKEEYQWLKEVDRIALNNSVTDLDRAYQNFFSKYNNFPRFKKKNGKNSYRTNNINDNIRIDKANNIIRLPKLKDVKIKGYRNIFHLEGRIINATISKENNRYYVAVLYDVPETVIVPVNPRIVGIDLGIKALVTTSEGESFDNLKAINKYEKRLKRLQRELARRIKGSKNYQKTIIKIGAVYRKIKNTRKYHIHRITKILTEKYSIIIAETLKIKKMVQNHKLAKAIEDASWYEIIRQLAYKTRWKGSLFYQIDTFYPSSQICFICGDKNPIVKKLNIRKWTCPKCHCEHDRDINAAMNIMLEGMKQNFTWVTN